MKTQGTGDDFVITGGFMRINGGTEDLTMKQRAQ